MSNLLQKNAKICLTAAGCLIHQDKVLLVKHKKVKTWLNPGGHIEANEAPHTAAEREFWEETGVKVAAYDFGGFVPVDESMYFPNPYATNLHWVSETNYLFREKEQKKQLKNGRAKKTSAEDYLREKQWSKGCEQHLNLLYLVKPIAGVEFRENVEETDGIAWFSLEELAGLDLFPNVQQEIEQAFKITSKNK
jgi:8-oxo-dGTP pyrophosphatase MutT (NUDIX family)